MAPTLVREPFHRDGWVYEEKVDGWWMLAYGDGTSVRLGQSQRHRPRAALRRHRDGDLEAVGPHTGSRRRGNVMRMRREVKPVFDVDRFKGECCAAATDGAAQQVIRDIVTRAVEAPAAVLKALGEPRRAEVQTLHRSADLTILNVIWGPRMTVMPHNHNMWAIIAIYTGREDNILWRRLPDDPGGRIEAAGAKALGARDALPLGRDIIHSVTNPIGRLTGAIHVYGGDFFAVPRSEWDPERLVEQPGDVQRTRQLFEESNRLYAARQ
jgi:predicted metal-dependent enzyme (double-stranded beta helix superfamily)